MHDEHHETNQHSINGLAGEFTEIQIPIRNACIHSLSQEMKTVIKPFETLELLQNDDGEVGSPRATLRIWY